MSGRTIFILKTVTGCINPLSGFTWRESALRYGRGAHHTQTEGEGERAAQGELFIA